MASDLSQHTLWPWVVEPLVKVLGQQFGDLVCRVQDNRMGHTCSQTVCVAQSRPDSGMTRQLFTRKGKSLGLGQEQLLRSYLGSGMRTLAHTGGSRPGRWW